MWCTSHSCSPWLLSGFDFLTATGMPTPTLAGSRVFSSTHPLKTLPKPPSPSIVSGLKFLVAFFSFPSVNIFRFGVITLPTTGAGDSGGTTSILISSSPPPLSLGNETAGFMLSPPGFTGKTTGSSRDDESFYFSLKKKKQKSCNSC